MATSVPSDLSRATCEGNSERREGKESGSQESSVLWSNNCATIIRHYLYPSKSTKKLITKTWCLDILMEFDQASVWCHKLENLLFKYWSPMFSPELVAVFLRSIISELLVDRLTPFIFQVDAFLEFCYCQPSSCDLFWCMWSQLETYLNVMFYFWNGITALDVCATFLSYHIPLKFFKGVSQLMDQQWISG